MHILLMGQSYFGKIAVPVESYNLTNSFQFLSFRDLWFLPVLGMCILWCFVCMIEK